MANRPVFEVMEQAPFFRRINIDFTFYNGFSFQQKQRCIRSLHGSYREVTGNDEILEVSSESDDPLGIALSAFNLSVGDDQGNRLTVESLFQRYKDNHPINPPTYFFDWLYVNTLHQNPELAEGVIRYKAFTDIEFNPARQINCQAEAAAIYVGLKNSGKLEEALEDKDTFRRVVFEK